MVYNFFDKKLCAKRANKFAGSGVKNENMSNQELTKKLHKSNIKKLEKRKVHTSFTENIWCADLADMQLISKINKGFHFLLCVIDINSKYVVVVPLKDSEFYNRSMKSCLQDNNIEMF